MKSNIFLVLLLTMLLAVSCDDDDGNNSNNTSNINNTNNLNNTSNINNTSNATCNNMVAEAGEVCDLTDMNGETCASLGYLRGGDLMCNGDCLSFIVSGCKPGFAQLATGANHTCALGTADDLWCWGSNLDLELGTPQNLDDSSSPILASQILQEVTEVKAGGVRSCGLFDDTSLVCWGDGAGTVVFDTPDLTAITTFSVGPEHVCMASSTGVWCWGNNADGQLGNGSTTDSDSPVAVVGLTGADEIVAGGYATCATSGGVLYCWGDNSDGQLGNGSAMSSNTPVEVDVTTSGDLDSLVAGDNFACALDVDGAAWCWGDNYRGQLGTGDNTSSNVPTPVTALESGLAVLSAAAETVCGVDTMGDAWCWGNNATDQLGQGALHGVSSSNVPVAVDMPDGESFDKIAVGTYHVCAGSAGAYAWCWGNNDFGQLGTGTTSAAFAPAEVQ